MKKEEVSRVIPIRSIYVLIVAFLSAILIGEIFNTYIYIALVMMFIGVFLLSFRFGYGLPKGISALLPLLTSVILLSFVVVGIKFALTGLEFETYLLYQFIGFFAGTIPLWFFRGVRKDFIRGYKKLKNLKLVLSAELFDLVGFLLIVYAISIGPVSLITSLRSLNILFVLLFAFLISRLRPNILKEEFGGKVAWIKLFGVVLLVLGTFIIMT